MAFLSCYHGVRGACSRPTVATLLLAVLIAASSLSCGSDDNLAEPEGSLGVVRISHGNAIRIRSLNAISGDNAYLGIGNQRGIELAVANYGSIKGFPVDLGAGIDGLCAAEGGQAAAQTIVADEQVVGVIGPSCSATATAAAPLITEAGMVMISPSNTSPALTSDLAGNPGSSHSAGYFRTSHNDLFQGSAVAEFLHTKMGLRTVAAIHDGDPYTHGLVTAFSDAFEALGGSTTNIGQINKEDIDMVPVLTELAANQPEALFFPVFRPAGDYIAEQVHNVPGFESVLLITAPSLGGDFLALPQSAGMFFSGPDIRLGRNTNQATGVNAETALNHYVTRYGTEPESPYWAHAYDATTLLLDAITASSSIDDGTLVIDREGVRNELHSTSDYAGLIGTINCDQFGDCGTHRLVIIEHLDPSEPAASRENIVFELTP